MTRRWSTAADAKLRRLYARTAWPQLRFQFKRTRLAITQRARKLGIQRARFWTNAELRLLRKRYPHEATEVIAHDLCWTTRAVYAKANKMGLRKTKAFLDSAAYKEQFRQQALTHPACIASRFKKGQIPANKGMHQPGWAPGRMASTQFKKGRPAAQARNYVPIGTEKYDPKRKTTVRKITDDPSLFPANRWKPVHVIVWEAVNGAVPKGHIVRFKKGLKTLASKDIRVEQLEMVTLAENMRMNSYHFNYPKEVGLAIQAKSLLTRAINRATKGNAP